MPRAKIHVDLHVGDYIRIKPGELLFVCGTGPFKIEEGRHPGECEFVITDNSDKRWNAGRFISRGYAYIDKFMTAAARAVEE